MCFSIGFLDLEFCAKFEKQQLIFNYMNSEINSDQFNEKYQINESERKYVKLFYGFDSIQ